jgi:hypothetical protein
MDTLFWQNLDEEDASTIEFLGFAWEHTITQEISIPRASLRLSSLVLVQAFDHLRTSYPPSSVLGVGTDIDMHKNEKMLKESVAMIDIRGTRGRKKNQAQRTVHSKLLRV